MSSLCKTCPITERIHDMCVVRIRTNIKRAILMPKVYNMYVYKRLEGCMHTLKMLYTCSQAFSGSYTSQMAD